jgi:hypothetical protein
MKDRGQRPKRSAARAARDKRLAEALRVNLKRRKAGAKANAGAGGGDKPTAERS